MLYVAQIIFVLSKPAFRPDLRPTVPRTKRLARKLRVSRNYIHSLK
jgi:hypothetical protein